MNDQEGTTTRDYATDKKNKDVEQLDKGEYKIDVSDQDASVDRDKDTAEARNK